MHIRLSLGLSLILAVSTTSLFSWNYYRDRFFFVSPIQYSGEVPVREDEYGNGHFGAKRRGGRAHRGLDIYAPLNSEVFASKGGIISTALEKNGMGKYIIIEHPGGYSTLYGHLSEISVRDGQRVRQGDVIGFVGKTGNARYANIKPHLHFEVRKDGQYLAPLLFLK